MRDQESSLCFLPLIFILDLFKDIADQLAHLDEVVAAELGLLTAHGLRMGGRVADVLDVADVGGEVDQVIGDLLLAVVHRECIPTED